MIGNAVPVKMAEVIANKILEDLQGFKVLKDDSIKSLTTAINGNLVREKMSQIVNNISV